MTKESLAALLSGREYGSEITRDEQRQAADTGLVVLFGYSDDNAEFRGAIREESTCYGGRVIFIHKHGVLDYHEEPCDCHFCGYVAARNKCAEIKSIWDKNGYSWTYETSIPHATFDVCEDGEKYCRGIVFELNSLPSLT